jgi:hypothetical protein
MNPLMKLRFRLLFATALSAVSAMAHPHGPEDADHTHGAVLLAAAKASEFAPPGEASGQIILGTGEFRYVYLPNKLVLPETVKMKHGHGLCRDDKGLIYFAFEPSAVDATTRTPVRFAADGTGATLLGGDNALAHGAPHGLNIHIGKDGHHFLYHANNDATVQKTSLAGDVLWSQKWPPAMGNYKPTDVVVPEGSDKVLVADGYGSSMIHALKTGDGVYAGKSWGGLGAAHGELNCPHGITYDPRRKLLLIADRGNKRLEYYTPAGAYHSSVQVKEITAPCNADVWGDYVLVPDLNGPLIILDKENQPVSVLPVGAQMGDLGFKHPHDAIFLENGDIVVATWNPGRIGYLKRLEK